jgi:hypothetical protein
MRKRPVQRNTDSAAVFKLIGWPIDTDLNDPRSKRGAGLRRIAGNNPAALAQVAEFFEAASAAADGAENDDRDHAGGSRSVA